MNRPPLSYIHLCLIAKKGKKANEEKDFNYDEDKNKDYNEIDIDVENMNSNNELITNERRKTRSIWKKPKKITVFIKELL